MRLIAPTLLLTAAVAGGPTSVLAHHSAAQFDSTQTVSVDGIVSRYEWANPHVYIFVTAPATDGRLVEWEIEGQPPAILRRQGWSAATLAVGDAVQISGNPHRGGAPNLLLTKLEKAGGTLYDPQRLMAALGSSDPERAATATGLAGVWVTLLDMNAMLGFVNPAKRLSLTEAGHAAVAAYDERTMSPAINCVPFPAPGGMIAPDVKRIAIDEHTVRIGGEFDNTERVVHLGLASHDGAEPSAQGHSIGRFEGKTLVIARLRSPRTRRATVSTCAPVRAST